MMHQQVYFAVVFNTKRQPYVKYRSPSQPASGIDMPGVTFDNLLYNRQPQTVSAFSFVCGKKWFEDALQIFLFDSDAIV